MEICFTDCNMKCFGNGSFLLRIEWRRCIAEGRRIELEEMVFSTSTCNRFLLFCLLPPALYVYFIWKALLMNMQNTIHTSISFIQINGTEMLGSCQSKYQIQSKSNLNRNEAKIRKSHRTLNVLQLNTKSIDTHMTNKLCVMLLTRPSSPGTSRQSKPDDGREYSVLWCCSDKCGLSKPMR